MKKFKVKLKVAHDVEFQTYQNDNGDVFVNGEELWNWLGVKTEFHTWIKRRVSKYKFIINNDYICWDYGKISEFKIEHASKDDFSSDNQARALGYYQIYWLKPDMAKQLAMVEDADKGKIVREYYLAMEKYILETNQELAFYQWRRNEAKEHHINHLDNKDKHSINIDKALYKITSYVFRDELNGRLYKKDDLLISGKVHISAYYEKLRKLAYERAEKMKVAKGKVVVSDVINYIYDSEFINKKDVDDFFKGVKSVDIMNEMFKLFG